ncbi:MAG: rRNA pseudouridine synthase [Holosporaceae bacterium]|jgi:23S rRNA pseudouridine2605 synthase|nr:rRNA pseudouridine synthase [Holosporaceae bacterium]
MRLAKKIAESGVASRREAEKLIETGRVSVNGNIVATPVFFVDESHEIRVDGQLIQNKSAKIIIWKFYKPRGVITSQKDPQNRKNVLDFFPEKTGRIIYVGRLDYNSEGLLLFTNDGNVARKMELPSTGLKRTYHARILGRLTDDSLKKLKNGITINGIKYGPVEIIRDPNDSAQSANRWITVTISEGKNREIRKIMEHFGCVVNRLIRIAYGPFCLNSMLPGQIVQIPDQEIKKNLKFYAL